jgi:hypothetical protein
LADSSQGRSRNGARPLLALIIELAVGYLTIIGFLFYPIGILVFSLQIWNAYPYGLSDVFFAASLIPIPVIAGEILDFLLWAFLAMGAAQGIVLVVAMPRWRQDEVSTIAAEASSLPEADRERVLNWQARQDRHYKYQRLGLLGSAFLTLSAPVALQLILFHSWRTWALYIAFVIFSCIGGVAAGLLARLLGQGEPFFSSDWKALAVAYAFGILAGIALAATSSPSLPLVAFESAEEKEGRLLSHKEGYWYVFDAQGTLRAVSDDDAGDVRFLRNDCRHISC